MSNSNGFQGMKLGHLSSLLSDYMYDKVIAEEFDRYPKQAIVSLGQGGGRIGAELSRFGHPTFLFNSSVSDMNEHKALIPDERRIVTKSSTYIGLEGTDKDARLGFEIANENKDLYKDVALSKEVREAEFVWVTVSLGGGTGNGALKVVLNYLSQVRAHNALPGGKIPLGVICSLPSTSEKGSAFRKNAIAGLAVIQEFIDQNKMGIAIVIDNEKMANYYTNTDLSIKLRKGKEQEVDARSFTNLTIASTLAEIGVLPLLNGRSVYDKTELLATWSTPGWGTVSKRNIQISGENISDTIDYESEVKALFKENEVLAEYQFERAISGAIAIIYPSNKRLSPRIADQIFDITSDILDTKVNLSISTSDNVRDQLLLLGIAVVDSPPTRVGTLREELVKWDKIEKEAEESRKSKNNNDLFDGFDDFFTAEAPKRKNNGDLLLSDLPGANNIELKDIDEDESKNKVAKSLDLTDL